LAPGSGLRLDHLVLSPAIVPRLKAAGVDRDVRGESEASDHAPSWIELKSPRRGNPKRKRRSGGARRLMSTDAEGKVGSVCADPKHRFSKTPCLSIELVAGFGIEGDVPFRSFVRHRYLARRTPRADGFQLFAPIDMDDHSRRGLVAAVSEVREESRRRN
jgi:hypothetical protein